MGSNDQQGLAVGQDAYFNRRLAEKIAAFRVDMVTPLALKQARMCILDTIGVTLAGIPEPCTQILTQTPGIASAEGPALIFGTNNRVSALDAAFINGTASHALDFDDFSAALGGHHSVPLVSTLLALASDRQVTGQQLIAAYVVGVETEIRLARAVNFHHYDKGWHPTATLGTFGGAAAACHLMGLSVDKITMALSIAASLASGIKANFGTMTKPLHIGQCSRNALMAALLAERGFEAAVDAMEHHQGFFDVYNGPGKYAAERTFENWGQPWEIEATSIGLKQFACCGSTHPAIMMALDIRKDPDFNADDIASIEIMPHERRLRHTNTPDPQSTLDSKFSVQYVVARALLDGAPRLKHFENDAYKEPAIQHLLSITQARPHPDMADDAEEQWGAEVIVTMKDGKTFSKRVDQLVGRGGDNPMSESELWDKFSDCAERVLPRDQIAPLFERLQTLETAQDLSSLFRLMTVGPLATKKPENVRFAHRDENTPAETTWVP